MLSDLKLYFFLHLFGQMRWLHFIAKYFSNKLCCEIIASFERLKFRYLILMVLAEVSSFQYTHIFMFQEVVIVFLTSVVVRNILFLPGARADENSWD